MKKLLILSLSLFSLLHAATDTNNSFIKAVKEDNVAEATKLLEEGANPNTFDLSSFKSFNESHIDERKFSLSYICNHSVKMNILLESNGWRIDDEFLLAAIVKNDPYFFLNIKKIGEVTSALHMATKNGSLEMVDLLLSNCAIIDNTALPVATDMNNIPLMKLLIAWGATGTALPNALANKSPEAIKILCKAGERPNDSHLTQAIESGNDEIAELVWAHGQPYYTLEGSLKAAVRIKSLPWVSRLLEKVNPSSLDSQERYNFFRDRTDLFIEAVVNQSPEIAELILSQRIEHYRRYYDESRPLHLVVKQGYISLTRKLLLMESSVNAQREKHHSGYDDGYYSYYDGDRKTALHIACENNDPEMVALLLEEGADANIPDKDDYLPINYAPPKSKISQLLIDKGTNLEKALHVAACTGQNKLAKLLLENSASLIKDDFGQDALNGAIKNKNNDLTTTLLAAGITPNDTSIRYTAELSDIELLQTLIDHGASVPSSRISLTDFLPKRSYYDGVLKEYDEKYEKVIMFLIEQGIEVNTPDSYYPNDTALHVCTEIGLNELVSILITHGADATLKNHYGKTPLMIAAEQKNKELVALLKPKNY